MFGMDAPDAWFAPSTNSRQHLQDVGSGGILNAKTKT